MINQEIMDGFYQEKRTESVCFVYNDYIQITSGNHCGRKGSIVSLVRIEPDVFYLVELDDDSIGDVEVPQGQLKLCD